MRPHSISRRLFWGTALAVLVFFMLAGFAFYGRYAEHLSASRGERLKSEIYLLMAATELDASGRLQLPATLAEPLFSLPASGLYASIFNPSGQEVWHSPSQLGRRLPEPQQPRAGEWASWRAGAADRQYQGLAYRVQWKIGGQSRSLLFVVQEDEQAFQAQLAQFRTLLWSWLGAAGVLLLLVQARLLRWGLQPLRRVEGELQQIEAGQLARISGTYPDELLPLTDRLNLLLDQERERQQRYRDALGDLAHSLKTPLAVLRQCRDEADYGLRLQEQLERMERIVAHQLGRAATRGRQALAEPIQLAPVLERLLAAMRKVHGARGLTFELECPQELVTRLDEGDLYEIAGNLLDNAGKWAQARITVSASHTEHALRLAVNDDGPGFADPLAAQQRGVRLDEAVDGQGIGLAVVADIVRSYGGVLSVANRTGGGATVSLQIPDQ
ncbi:ATP-binding protein [Chitinilyticum piscinae]|uniref:histidine kinase n=1 Tax=Chitinilyticum piscinae TaxID=2866724 RepID=A0A8J7FSG8_9NEIS|nr:ATP-binding protein [Chitinilyticum piscinae]MBE9609831.1 GHKL domain-containing protein [Chitinilyticum piscinae]